MTHNAGQDRLQIRVQITGLTCLFSHTRDVLIRPGRQGDRRDIFNDSVSTRVASPHQPLSWNTRRYCHPPAADMLLIIQRQLMHIQAHARERSTSWQVRSITVKCAGPGSPSSASPTAQCLHGKLGDDRFVRSALGGSNFPTARERLPHRPRAQKHGGASSTARASRSKLAIGPPPALISRNSAAVSRAPCKLTPGPADNLEAVHLAIGHVNTAPPDGGPGRHRTDVIIWATVRPYLCHSQYFPRRSSKITSISGSVTRSGFKKRSNNRL